MNRIPPYKRQSEMGFLLAIQQRYNAALSAHNEMLEHFELDRIMVGLVKGTGFWHHVMIPWYRLDLRIMDWMGEWDERFARRYSR